MENTKKKITRFAVVAVVAIVAIFALLNIKVHLEDIHPSEIGWYGPSLQLFGIHYRIEDHHSDETIPDDVAKLYVSAKDYFRAKDAISRSFALMGIIDESLYSFAENIGLTEPRQEQQQIEKKNN